jgi:hypothetical protein
MFGHAICSYYRGRGGVEFCGGDGMLAEFFLEFEPKTFARIYFPFYYVEWREMALAKLFYGKYNCANCLYYGSFDRSSCMSINIV